MYEYAGHDISGSLTSMFMSIKLLGTYLLIQDEIKHRDIAEPWMQLENLSHVSLWPSKSLDLISGIKLLEAR